jgi:hypothetical protein
MDNADYEKIKQVYIDFIIDSGLYYDPTRGIQPDSKFFNNKTFYSADNNEDDDLLNIESQSSTEIPNRRTSRFSNAAMRSATTINSASTEDSEVTNVSTTKVQKRKNHALDKTLAQLEKKKNKDLEDLKKSSKRKAKMLNYFKKKPKKMRKK